MCIGAIGRTIVYSSYIITNFKFLSDLNILVRVEYIGLSWMVLVFMLLTNSQFPSIINKRARKFIVGYLLLYTTIVVILPVYYFTQFIYIMEFVCMLAGLYTTIKIAQIAIQGNKDAILISIAGTLYMSCGTHDILIHNNILTGGSIEYQPIGFLIFLACESVVLAKKHVQALEENERAIIQIEAMAKRERETELKFLKSQIRPHFIHNALNAIISFSRTDPNRSRTLLVEFSRYLRNSFDFDNLDHLVSLEHEIQFVKSYLTIEEARFGERLLVNYEIEETSILIPPLILQPLAENAVVHGIHDGEGVVEILIYVKVMDDKIKIGVRDNGKGIPEEKIKELQANKSQGRGVGLRNINQRLQKIYGTSLIIENLNEKGCDISMCLPNLRGEVSFHEDNVN
jgi:sensor histidine kinase YesM